MTARQDDNLALAQMLRDACSRERIPNNVKLPGAIGFHLDDGTVRMDMPERCVLANMQDNTSSFEGWALAFMRWLATVKNVELSWERTVSVNDPHYQRFLFRVQQFLQLFPDWFAIPDQDNMDALDHLRTETSQPLLVTSPKKVRTTADGHRCNSMKAAIGNELELECYVKDNPETLSTELGLEFIDRQFPVGLFEGQVKKEHEIFPRGHSAIDLWAIRGDELMIFELKAEGNTRVGVLSELFFYSYIMDGVQAGRYTLQYANERIAATSAVRSYILAPQTHPLIDSSLLKMANDAFDASDRNIRFGIIDIDAEGESFDVKMPAV